MHKNQLDIILLMLSVFFFRGLSSYSTKYILDPVVQKFFFSVGKLHGFEGKLAEGVEAAMHRSGWEKEIFLLSDGRRMFPVLYNLFIMGGMLPPTGASG